jgi:hypothetical protein
MHAAIPGSRLALLSGGHLISVLPHRQQQFIATVLGFLPPGKPPSAALSGRRRPVPGATVVAAYIDNSKIPNGSVVPPFPAVPRKVQT